MKHNNKNLDPDVLNRENLLFLFSRCAIMKRGPVYLKGIHDGVFFRTGTPAAKINFLRDAIIKSIIVPTFAWT